MFKIFTPTARAAHFRYKIALPMGVNLLPRREHVLSVGVDTDRAALTVGVKILKI